MGVSYPPPRRWREERCKRQETGGFLDIHMPKFLKRLREERKTTEGVFDPQRAGPAFGDVNRKRLTA